MTFFTRARLALAAMLLAPMPIAMTGLPAQAAGCETDTYYLLDASATRMPFKGIPTYKDGPGGTLEVSRSYSGTVAYQVTAGAESEAGAVLAKAKVSISASLTKSNTTTSTHTYSHDIRPGMYGNVRYVSWGKKVNWVKKRRLFNCDSVVLARGTIKFPSLAEGWFYWQSSY